MKTTLARKKERKKRERGECIKRKALQNRGGKEGGRETGGDKRVVGRVWKREEREAIGT